jgi:hypothetical protein
MNKTVTAALLAFTLAAPALAASPMNFWNETSKEFTGVYLAPTGTTNWGKNQTLDDPDHAVSADERLKITDVRAGHYDVRLVDKKGVTCVVRGVEVKEAKVAFSINEKQLTDCK